jgi:hypothetical protein
VLLVITKIVFMQVILLKPILHTLAVALNDPDADHIPYVLSTATVRQVGDNYNWLLATFGDISGITRL